MRLLISKSATPTEPSKSYHQFIKMHDWHKRDTYDKHKHCMVTSFSLSRFYGTRPGDARRSCVETSRHGMINDGERMAAGWESHCTQRTWWSGRLRRVVEGMQCWMSAVWCSIGLACFLTISTVHGLNDCPKMFRQVVGELLQQAGWWICKCTLVKESTQ